jgi:hypothetical protein
MLPAWVLPLRHCCGVIYMRAFIDRSLRYQGDYEDRDCLQHVSLQVM